MTDGERESILIRDAVAGDRAALSQLLLLHFNELHRHVESRISHNLQGLMRADDILQQTFVRAAQAITTFQPRHEDALRGWLKTIADNLVRDAEKRRRRERRLFAFDRGKMQNGGVTTNAGAIEQLVGGHTSPSRRAHRRDVVRSMQVAMAGLPAEQRDMLRRRYLLGQSLDQISEATGRTKDAVRGLCFRARKNLRAVMGNSSLYFSG